MLAIPTSQGSGSTVDQNVPGAENVGKGDGSQFITGQCFSNADCASGCCATKAGAGVCSAKAVANVAGKEGCGFVAAGNGSTTIASTAGAASNDTSSSSSSSAAGSIVDENEPGAENVGKGNGSQFITGQCFSNADCASGCCAEKDGAGVCSAKAVANVNGKEGCGFTATKL